ncbi:MAG: hypothetical protein AAFX85_11555 [Pseudomonadota bacterium]
MTRTLDTPAFQRAIAELCVIPKAIELLRDDPEAFGVHYGLDAAQVEALTQAGLDRFHEFAEDLLAKRLSLIQRFSPALVELLRRRGDFAALFREFARLHPSRNVAEVPHKVVRDCQWFHAHIASWAEGREDAGPHLSVVLAFEQVQGELLADEAAAASARACAERNQRLATALRVDSSLVPGLRPTLGTHHRFVDFPCDVIDLIRYVTEKRPLPESLVPSPMTLMVAREPARRSIRYIRVNERTCWLLERCDGERRVAELVQDFRKRWAPDLSDDDAFGGVWRLLHGVCAMDMLSFELPMQAAASASP